MTLVIFGLVVSIPIIVWGSQLVVKMMDRFPIVITLGGMLLGWIAGGMMVTDPALLPVVTNGQGIAKVPQETIYISSIVGSLLVLAMGRWLASRKAQEKAEE